MWRKPPYAGGRPLSPDLAKHIPDLPRGPALPKVVVLCGPGNNGGDGAVLARHLDGWRFSVRDVWFARASAFPEMQPPTGRSFKNPASSKPHGLMNKRAIRNRTMPGSPGFWPVPTGSWTACWARDYRALSRASCTVIDAMNAAGKPILALDLPSGLDADTGVPLGAAVRAVATATFAAPKLGFSASGAVAYTGQVAVIDIGLPRCLLEPFYVS